MKDFPVFTTEYGVASLILREVPYRQEAYIHIQASETPEELLKECISFCRMVGAEQVFAQGHEYLEDYPLHSVIYEMRGEARPDESLVENLWPVTEETAAKWRGLMNERLAGVDHASTLESRQEKEIAASGGAYFVHHEGELLGGGWIEDGEVKLVASFKPGAGTRVMHTLMSLMPGRQVRLDVVSTNEKALRLYEKLGFIKTAEKRRWYRVFPVEV